MKVTLHIYRKSSALWTAGREVNNKHDKKNSSAL